MRQDHGCSHGVAHARIACRACGRKGDGTGSPQLGLDDASRALAGVRQAEMVVQVEVRARHEQCAPLFVREILGALLLSPAAEGEEIQHEVSRVDELRDRQP